MLLQNLYDKINIKKKHTHKNWDNIGIIKYNSRFE